MTTKHVERKKRWDESRVYNNGPLMKCHCKEKDLINHGSGLRD